MRLHTADDIDRAIGADGRFLERLPGAQGTDDGILTLYGPGHAGGVKSIAGSKCQVVIFNRELGRVADKGGDCVTLFKGV